MRRILLGIVLVVSSVAAVPVQAGCTPHPETDRLCSYLAIPQTGCRSVEGELTRNPNVPVPVQDTVRTIAACNKIPAGTKLPGQDGHVFYAGSNTVLPEEGTAVGMNKSAFAHNLDSVAHTFTEVGCMDALSSTPCRFDLAMPVGAWGAFAATFGVRTSNGFVVGQNVSFRCRIHPGETGTFAITA